MKTYFKTFFQRKPVPAYIHIPKTGGTYLAQMETKAKAVIQPLKYLGHTYITDNAGDHNVIYEHHNRELAEAAVTPATLARDYFLFSTVRNIFDWLVSYAGHAGGWNPRYRDPGHYDYGNAQKGFEYLLKTIADREDIWPCRKFIHCQIFSSDGSLVVDWINRNHYLDQDLRTLARRTGASYRSAEKQRVGKNNDYRTYYTDELIDLVRMTWGRELDLFGFDFDTYSPGDALLKESVDEHLKGSIRYTWNTDDLSISRERVPRT